MQLKGNISDFPLPDIIQLLGSGKKTGMLAITSKDSKAELFFEKGDVVHAEIMNTQGIDAVTKMFHIQEGRFHFYADVVPEAKTFHITALSLLMHAASTYDEDLKARGEFDSSGKKGKEHEAKITLLKQEMIMLVKDVFGKKANKIEQLINKCGNSEIELMSSCDKIEKYIYVFLDSQNYKAVADKIRNLIEEMH